MDLTKLSDADLDALSKNDMKSVSDEGLAMLHAQAPQTPPPKEEPGFLKQIGRATVDALPAAGGVVGGLIGTPADVVSGPFGTVAGAGLGYGAGVAARNAINSYFDPERAPQSLSENAMQVAKGIPIGAMQEMGGQITGNLIGRAANAVSKPVGDAAESLAVSATGATGKQAEKFAPGTGRALLDNGIVKFGRSQAGVADAAQEALDAEGGKIGSIIKDLSDKGAAGSREELVSGLQSKIDELAGNVGEADVVRKLKSILEDISAGPENPSLELMEQTKRSFQDAAKKGLTSYDVEGGAGRAADLYKEAAESIATKANPDAAKTFMDAKKLYGQLVPVAKASASRASQLNQSPVGGLGDFVAYGAGGMPGVIAKKAVLPRVNSSLASIANGLSQILQTSPEMFGKWARPLIAAAARGEMSLNAADYVLQQSDPGYREQRQKMNDIGSPDDQVDSPDIPNQTENKFGFKRIGK